MSHDLPWGPVCLLVTLMVSSGRLQQAETWLEVQPRGFIMSLRPRSLGNSGLHLFLPFLQALQSEQCPAGLLEATRSAVGEPFTDIAIDICCLQSPTVFSHLSPRPKATCSRRSWQMSLPLPQPLPVFCYSPLFISCAPKQYTGRKKLKPHPVEVG